jgi:ribokinase
MVVGSMNIDLIAYADRAPGPGETVMGRRFQQGFGGKGANQAVMAARLGADVRMAACLGDDVFAGSTRDNLSAQGVDTTFVSSVAGQSSGVAPIWVEPDGTNRIIVVPGANASLTAADAVSAVEATPRAAVVLGQLEVPEPVTAAAFARARDLGIVSVLNPAPAGDLSPELLAATDWLVPNETEFAALAPLAGGTLDPFEAEDVRRCAQALGVRLLVTLGAAGATWVGGDGAVRSVAAPQVQAVDTTGAGDAFVGAFAFGLASRWDEGAAVRLGCACASDSVTRRGTQASFPSTDAVAAMLRAARGPGRNPGAAPGDG